MTQTQMLEGVPLETYLRDSRLSTHLMSKFADQGPRMFIMLSASMVPPKEQTEEQRMGQMFEDIVQGRPPDLSGFAVRPKGMKFNEGSAKDPTTGKGWKAARDAEGKKIVDQEDLDAIQWMHESFLENEQAMDTIRHAKKQVSMQLDGTSQFGFKSRPDYLLDSMGTFVEVDLKTCSSLNVITSGRQVRDYRYYCASALRRRLLRAYRPGGSEHYLLACEKQSPYRVQLVRVSDAWLDAGDRWIDDQVAQIEACARADSWPRVLSEVVDLPPPPIWL